MAVNISCSPSGWAERIAIVAIGLLCCLMVQLTLWKESEIFWLQIGGYPLWLRDSIRTLYYPYIFFVFVSLLMISWSVLGRFLDDFKFRRIWLLLLVNWIIFCGCIGLLFSNNLMNFINEKPLHYHDWERVKAQHQEME